MTENNFTNIEVNKKTKSGRKGKKQWRKNIDLNQVEEGLQLNEIDEIKYGVSGSQIPDEALFEEDTLGNQQETAAPLIAKTTYIDRVLNSRSAVPSIQSKIPSQKKSAGQANKKTVVQPAMAKIFGKSKKARKLASLWDQEEIEEPKTENTTDNVSIDGPTVKRPHTMDMKPQLPADPTIVHPGYSYQPEKEKHKELIDLSQEQHQTRLLNSLKWRQVKETMTAGKKESGEMDDIEYSEEEEEKEEQEQEQSEDKSEEEEELVEKVTSADPKRLTKADRKKKNNLKMQKKLLNKKLKKKQENITFTNIKVYKKEADQVSKQVEEKAELTKKQAEETKLLPKTKFGRYAVQPDKVEVNSDVTPTLRNIQTASNPFQQHYHTFTKKNLVEPRNRIRNKKRSKVKAFEKPSSKNFS